MHGKGIAGKTWAPPAAKCSVFRGVKGRSEWVGSPVLCPFDAFPASRLAGNDEACLALEALCHVTVPLGEWASIGTASLS